VLVIPECVEAEDLAERDADDREQTARVPNARVRPRPNVRTAQPTRNATPIASGRFGRGTGATNGAPNVEAGSLGDVMMPRSFAV